jgi:hypothetical protein
MNVPAYDAALPGNLHSSMLTHQNEPSGTRRMRFVAAALIFLVAGKISRRPMLFRWSEASPSRRGCRRSVAHPRPTRCADRASGFRHATESADGFARPAAPVRCLRPSGRDHGDRRRCAERARRRRRHCDGSGTGLQGRDRAPPTFRPARRRSGQGRRIGQEI